MDNMPNLTAAQFERLGVLFDELGEVVQAAAKTQRHGYTTYHPDTHISNAISIAAPKHDNKDQLEYELGHILYAMELLANAGDIDLAAVNAYKVEKQKRKNNYLHHQPIVGP